MRTLFYLFTLLFITNTTFAQLTNTSFENWNSVSTEKVATWESQGVVTKVGSAQAGNFAIKLETDVQGGSSVFLSTPFTNGYPYFNKVDTVKIWVKYSIANGDTGTFHIEQFNSDTNLVRAGEYFITTGTATQWTEISIPLLAFDTSYAPQTIAIYAENTLNYDPKLSSYLIIDNIRCYYKGVLQSNIPNNSFENWTTKTVNNIVGWTTSNELFAQFGIDSVNCERVSPGQSGTYAVKLHTVDLFGGGPFIPGGIVTGSNQGAAAQTPNAIPTIAVNQRYSSLSGYLKFNKKGSDSGEAAIYMFNSGNLVGEGHYRQGSTISAYTLFEAKIKYNPGFSGVPDSATIVFITSSDPQNATGTSEMWVDNIQLNQNALGLNKTGIAVNSVYPNPFSQELKVEISADKANCSISSLDGKEMISQNLSRGTNLINTSGLAQGFYIIKITDGEQSISRKMVKE